MIKIIQFIFFLLFSINLWAYRKDSLDTSNHNECLWNKEVIDGLVECNDLFQNYKPEVTQHQPTGGNIRLGAFNVFRLSEQRKNKNFDWMVELINSEWDVVALSELQANNTSLQKANGKLFENFTEGLINHQEFTKKYTLPAHIHLLLKLRKKDPSWGLILSPFSQGSDSELFGFLYRSSHVDAIESEYCKTHFIENSPWPSNGFIYRETGKDGFSSNDDGSPINHREFISPKKALACPLALKGVDLEQFPKVPLTARFRSGHFEFNYISLHLSFGSYGEFYKKCLGRCQLNALKLLSTFSGDDTNAIYKFITEYMNNNSDLIREQEFIKPTNCNALCRKNYKREQEVREAEIMNPVYDVINQMAKNDPVFSNIVFPVLLILNKENGGRRAQISKEEGREINRFFQAKAVMQASFKISNIEKNNDVIVAGDFNIETTKTGIWQTLLWNEALSHFPNSQVLVTDETSISFNKNSQTVEYVSNYDHFVLVNSAGATDECDPASASRVDFINELYVLSNGYSLGKKIQDHKNETLQKGVRYVHPLSDHVPITLICSIKGMT